MRRVSPRLREIPEDKRPYYGVEDPKRRRFGKPHEEQEEPTKDKKKEKKVGPRKTTETELAVAGLEHHASLVGQNGTDFVRRVKETLRHFNLHYLRFSKEEDLRINKHKELEAENGDCKKRSRRPDLKAMEKMRSKKEFLFPKKILGPIPGIKVGFQFFSRTEMVTVGMHTHWLSGISFISKSTDLEKGNKDAENGYSFPLATAIVLSGQYQDDVDNSEEILYTGQGGNDLLGNKLQIKDQTLTRGNLALKNCVENSTPVRVIRGHKYDNSYTKRVYTYDGLYKVVDYWPERGVAGFIVYKYKLKRLPGQPGLVTNEVCFVRGEGSKAQAEIPGMVCKDISEGLENVPVPVTNIIDDPPLAPEGFTYINSIEIASNIKIPPNAPGCKCKDKCTDPETCSCAKLNSSDFPYVVRDGGRLIEPKDIVFECGPNCGCGPGCVNRTSQRGLKYRLEIYRTFDKGWAVRSWDYIPSGAPVCEYIGVLRKTDDLENATANDYIFEIDCLQTINEIGCRERRLGDVALPSSHAIKTNGKISEAIPEFCLDSGTTGNVARFINHSCEPNLFVQCILSSHHDITLARIVLFAADTIVPLQELTYDYGYELDSVVGPDGKIKRLPCYCGATCCRGRLY